MPLEEDPMFSPNSFQPNWDKMISLALNMLSWKKVHLSSPQAGEGALTSCKKSDIFCEIDKGLCKTI